MAIAPKSKSRKHTKEIKEFAEEVIQIDRVVRVVKGGRRLRFRATVAIGNRMGKVGVGIGKSQEVTGAIQKAIAKAKKNLIEVPIYNGTIPHDINFKFKSAKLLLIPAGPGTGIIAGGPIRKIANLAGIKNILSKSLGSSNKVNLAQATVKTLAELRELPWGKKDDLEAELKKEEAKKAKKEAEAEKQAAQAEEAAKKAKAAKKAEASQKKAAETAKEVKVETPTEEAPKEEAPSEEPKEEETPTEESKKETKTEEAPKEETPSEEAPKEEK